MPTEPGAPISNILDETRQKSLSTRMNISLDFQKGTTGSKTMKMEGYCCILSGCFAKIHQPTLCPANQSAQLRFVILEYYLFL